jgi:hypothetical protein
LLKHLRRLVFQIGAVDEVLLDALLKHEGDDTRRLLSLL